MRDYESISDYNLEWKKDKIEAEKYKAENHWNKECQCQKGVEICSTNKQNT